MSGTTLITGFGPSGFVTLDSINDAGQMAGYVTNLAGNSTHAFLLPNGPFGPEVDLGPSSINVGVFVNNAGEVAFTSVESGHLELYQNGSLTSPGDLVVSDINNLGQVVGEGRLYAGGQISDLNDLISPTSGWTIDYSTSINDAGQIVGWGEAPGGAGAHGLLLTPVPEPSSLNMFGLGSVAIAIWYLRRRFFVITTLHRVCDTKSGIQKRTKSSAKRSFNLR